MATPFMGLTLPTVSVTPGPLWATYLNAAFSLVDSHSHVSGQGVLITPAAININADLEFNSNDATELRSVRLESQATALVAGTDVGCLYNILGNPTWNDASATPFRLVDVSFPLVAGDIIFASTPTAFSRLGIGTASQVLTVSGGVPTWQLTSQAPMPVGMIVDYGGAAAPTGWLLCNGAAVSQVTYADLFAAIGANWNTGGEGAGNFRLPDFLGRTPVGAGAGSGLTARTLGSYGGEETHVLTVAQLALHNHGGGNHDHLQSYGTADGAFGNVQGYTTEGAVTGPHPVSPAISNAGSIATKLSGTVISDAGTGQAHNNMQPFAVATKIIKAFN